MIHNSDFGGRTILQHWLNFARGMCPKGNVNQTKDGEEYNWYVADQPGLWYAMMRTYAEYYPDRIANFRNLYGEMSGVKALPNDTYPQCNDDTGVLDPPDHEHGQENNPMVDVLVWHYN